jgi:SAM-dependent methyltransferase
MKARSTIEGASGGAADRPAWRKPKPGRRMGKGGVTTGLDGLDHVLSADFQSRVAATTKRWDKEWLRYLAMPNRHYQSYFYIVRGERHRLVKSIDEIRALSAEEFYHAPLFKGLRPHIWLPGDLLVSRVVLDMGCGPGLFGRLAGQFAEAYIGIDASRFALSIAKLTSPRRCSYIHLANTQRIAALKKSVDVCVSRHFFIHHNYADSLWILKFLRDLTRSGGIIQADFYSNPEAHDGTRRLKAADALSDDRASALFDFTDEDIARIAVDSGLDCRRIEYRPELENRFATFRVP